MGDGLVVTVDQFNRIAGADITLLAYPEVETQPAARLEARREVELLSHSYGKLVTGDARLGDLEQHGANAEQVAHAGRIFADAGDGEVLAKLTERQVSTPELGLPEPVVLVGIGVHGHVSSTVDTAIRLAVAIEAERACSHACAHRLFEDPGRHRLSAVGDFPGETDIDREKLHELEPHVAVFTS